jgi:hypothetical protein
LGILSNFSLPKPQKTYTFYPLKLFIPAMAKKILTIICLIIIFVGGPYVYLNSKKYKKEPVPEQIKIKDVIAANAALFEADSATENEDEIETEDKTEDESENPIKKPTPSIPEELNLQATFYPQAPFANWDYPWQEACEEASVLLVANTYFEHNWTLREFNDEILALVDWENERFGSYEHTSVDQTVEILEDYLDLETVVHQNPTLDDVKGILARGHLIVMTFSGKELGNPFFTNGGPNYHAMMIKGYKADGKIIAHDVGTRRGEDYVYTWKVIESSLHDYAEPIQDGAKRYIEVLPPK